MYFHIMSKDNKSVIGGKLVLMRPHTCCSETVGTRCYLVYMHEVVINENLFSEWATKHLKYNNATGSGGIKATSEYDYIEFSLGEFRNDYDFLITDTHMS